MQVLIAVADDLIQFVCKAFSGAVPYAPQEVENTLDSYQKTLQKIKYPAPHTVATADTSTSSSAIVDVLETFRVGETYFVGDIGTYIYNDPIQAFDNALKRLEYGQHIRLISLRGRWAEVRLGDTVGWIFKDSLVLQSDQVYPRFMTGIPYDADYTDTIKLRACIDDMFGGARGAHALSAAEYVHYKLQQKKRVIEWGDIRMRIPGTWQRKLRGRLGIHIGILPKTESVMEYVIDDIGHLAFVEAVFPDGSIKITEIGKMDDSMYTEEIVHPDQWKESHPVFIEIE